MKNRNLSNRTEYLKILTQLIVALFFSFSQAVSAQNYPVQVSTQLYPPYSLKLSDYATANSEKLLLNILMTDITEAGRQVRLRFSVEGSGLHIESNDFVIGASPLFLDGGIPLRLTNLDLRSFFELKNLRGISPQQYQRPLPQGMYSFCFEVFDWISGQRLSQKSCFQAFLIINDPPFLNLPRSRDLIAAKDPQHIMFTWTPRHLNATGVQYEFELRELWDSGMDPRAAFLASPSLYKTTTHNTSLLYGPGNTPLLENRTYAWRVRALVTDGISETSVFRNNGYSEIFHFSYTATCRAPQFVLASSLSAIREEITWQPDPEHISYRVQYRRKGVRGAVWFESNAVNPHTTLYNLEPGTTYEYRVGGQCMEPVPNAEARFSYTGVQEFTTPQENKEDIYYNCGIAPEIDITNRKPLDNIGVNEVFTAGDFPVTIKEVYGGNGQFSGLGYIVVPYLADTKIAVEFRNIRINTDYQLYDGVLRTTYDVDWENVDDLQDEIDAVGEIIERVDDLANTIEDVIDEMVKEGELSESERDEKLNQLAKLRATAQTAGDLFDRVKKDLKEDREKADEEEIQNTLKKLEFQKASISSVELSLEYFAKELGISALGDVWEDSEGYFDGYLAIGEAPNGVSLKQLDDNSDYVDVPSDLKSPIFENGFYKDAKVRVEGVNYTFLHTSSASTDEELERARQMVENPSGDIAIHFHYDTEKDRLGYRVEMARDYFSNNLSEEHFEQARVSFKSGIKNLINELAAVEDWSTVLLEITLGLNNKLKDALASMQVPKGFWNPDAEGYDNISHHMAPVGAGLIDAAIEEVSDIPTFISLIVDYSTDVEERERINRYFEDFEFKRAIEGWYNERKDLYQNEPEHLVYYQTGKDITQAGIIIGTGGLASVKKGGDFVKELVEKIKKNAKDGITELDWARFLDEFGNRLGNSKDAFRADFENVPGALEMFLEKPSLVESWKLLNDAGRTALKVDLDVLTKLNKVLQNTKLDNFLPINTATRNITNKTELVKQIVKLQAEAGSIVGKRMSGMGDLMDDLDYFLVNFADKPGASEFIKELSESGGKMAGGSFVLRTLKNNSDELGTVVKFESTIASQVDEIGDIVVDVITDRGVIKNVFNEFKNWRSIPTHRFSSFSKQFSGYLANRGVGEFSYFFKKGIGENGFNNLSELKDQIVKAFSSTAGRAELSKVDLKIIKNITDNPLLDEFDKVGGLIDYLDDLNNFEQIFKLIN